MDAAGVGFDRVVDPSHVTTTRVRCVSRHHPMLRADFEAAPVPAMRARLAERVARALPLHDVVVFSDDAKGALDDCAPLVQAAHAAGKTVLVDPAGRDWSRYAGATLVKPNESALAALWGEAVDGAALERRLTETRRQHGWRALLLTRGEHGMTLFDDAGVTHERARVRHARELRDVTGAGDTVLAVLAWRLAEGDDAVDAMRWASMAAGLAVRTFGTVTVTREQVVDAWDAVR